MRRITRKQNRRPALPIWNDDVGVDYTNVVDHKCRLAERFHITDFEY